MSANTKIQWATYTFNPWIGCTKASPGCANCYAETLDKRMWGGTHWGKGAARKRTKNWREPELWNHKAAQCGERPRVFSSLCDWLDDEVPDKWLADFFMLIWRTPFLNWLLLTKRPEQWRSRVANVLIHWSKLRGGEARCGPVETCMDWLSNWANEDRPLSNVWFGVSVEDQQRADERILTLLNIPAALRFLSVEPCIGSVNLEGLLREYDDSDDYKMRRGRLIDWVIIGGESGPKARPCDVAWVKDILIQCSNADVPCFVKQLGSFCVYQNGSQRKRWLLNDPQGGDPSEWTEDLCVREFPRR